MVKKMKKIRQKPTTRDGRQRVGVTDDLLLSYLKKQRSKIMKGVGKSSSLSGIFCEVRARFYFSNGKFVDLFHTVTVKCQEGSKVTEVPGSYDEKNFLDTCLRCGRQNINILSHKCPDGYDPTDPDGNGSNIFNPSISNFGHPPGYEKDSHGLWVPPPDQSGGHYLAWRKSVMARALYKKLNSPRGIKK